ncbi:unnamed protein product [Didymodactylos carnosus]|uniref:Uncharacterized protein n=1 Tax=Didymodactylos carnosus TaxID=1234261 RepID=A0A814HFJ8_9BILA|nr:unnamed protein product [Didymodactylos carnosus]CAF1008795.1 unnamed protein product [Didymodactylos carnosus]CAF3640955.1 unnamed protein product [Didymodactylos carnosus]CAF3779920.1 unnamed protein product [Didymodactylos carnosus]
MVTCDITHVTTYEITSYKKCCHSMKSHMINMPWKKQKKRSGSSKEHCVVLLLGGSIYDESAGGVRIVQHGRRRDDETRRTKKDVEKDSFLWKRDFHALTTLFERNGATVWRSIPTAMHCSKLDTIEHLLSFFTFDDIERQRRGMAYRQATTFIIYWCGHGVPYTGNWGFSEGETITCDELINLWTSANREDRDALTIIADTCFSGAWIDELRTKQIPNLAYQAACRSDETAWIFDDREVPRSLLMRRFFLEIMEETESTDDRVYIWTCPTQRPIFFCDYVPEQETERRALVRGAFFFFSIDEHAETDKNHYYAEPNGGVRHGKFLKATT